MEQMKQNTDMAAVGVNGVVMMAIIPLALSATTAVDLGPLKVVAKVVVETVVVVVVVVVVVEAVVVVELWAAGVAARVAGCGA